MGEIKLTRTMVNYKYEKKRQTVEVPKKNVCVVVCVGSAFLALFFGRFFGA
jgi:hypothetical protein